MIPRTHSEDPKPFESPEHATEHTADERGRGERNRDTATRHRCRSQHGVHFLSQTSAGDQADTVHHFGEEVEHLHRHPSAERMPDHRGRVDSEIDEEVADGRSVRAQRVVSRGLVGLTVPWQIHRDDPEVR